MLDDWTITEGATFAIAISALVTAIWQGSVAQRHAKLSVRPRLFFDTVAFLDREAGLLLDNGGLGPAIIASFGLFVDGERVGGSETEDGGWNEAFKRLPNGFAADTYWLGVGQIVKPGEMVFIISLSSPRSRQHLEELEDVIRRLEISVSYESMYGEQFAERWPMGRGMALQRTDLDSQGQDETSQ